MDMANVSGKVGVEEYVDNFLSENSALRRKLQSKAEALLILSKELDQCRTERDQFKLMAEQLQDRYSMLKKKSHDMGFSRLMFYPDGVDSNRTENSLAQVLGECKEQNKALRIEVEDLRQKLRDAQGDIKVLRVKLGQQRSNTNVGEVQAFPAHQREELVQQLETLSLKCTQMAADLQAVLDEKEELVMERDAYKCKVHRLNHELNALLKGDSKQLVDIDALVMENRYLQERLQQAEEEKELSTQALSKYKSMLDKKRSKGTVKLGTNNHTGTVMSHKQGIHQHIRKHTRETSEIYRHNLRSDVQSRKWLENTEARRQGERVQQLLEKGTSAQLPNTAATLSDMKSLCLALLEALGDKTLALSHQKKANRILASRISDLEEAVQGGRVAAFPSQLLLEGYASSEVDRDMGHILSPERPNGSDSEGECITSIHLDTQHLQDSLTITEIDAEPEITVTDCIDTSKRPSPQDFTGQESRKSSPRQHLSNGHNTLRGPDDTTRGSIGDGYVSPHPSSAGQEDSLPPHLQQLVQRALDEIKQKAKKGC